MARKVEKLSAVGVAKTTRPGYHNDGAGLYLQVSPSGSKSWVLRYKLGGRSREMGLGSVHTFGLADARDRARAARKLLADGVDPIESRRQTKLMRAMEAARAVTFRADAEACIEAMRAEWKGDKQESIWRASLETYAYPVIGDKIVSQIEPRDVKACVEPIWKSKTETATRVRARIEKVLDWSKSHGHRQGENPAAWKGNLEHMLPKPGKVTKVEHHASVPYREIAAFMVRLHEVGGMGARALEFAILTAARSGEVRGATWGEVDLEAKVWTIAAERMKMEREHRVPLSKPAIELLKAMDPGASDELVFPASKGGMLSDMTLSAVMKRMQVDAVPHGFRATFKDWAREQTNFPRDVVEAALAHAVGDRVEAAYVRGDLFEKRAKLMEAWAQYIARREGTAKVVSLHAA